MNHGETAMDEPTRTKGERRNGARRMSGSAAAERAKDHLLELTGKTCESVSSLAPGQEGWNVTLEVVELERIPHTTDILATYLVELDQKGELMRYERVNRYYRNQPGER